jgi:hypothetical protein
MQEESDDMENSNTNSGLLGRKGKESTRNVIITNNVAP